MQIDWSQASRLYEAGLDRGVLYFGESVVPWNGLTTVDTKDTGGVDSEFFFDGIRRLVFQENSDFQASASSYTYPDALETHDALFGFSYREELGDHHLIHVVYNATIKAGSITYKTKSDGADLTDFTWDIYATPDVVYGEGAVSHVIIDTSVDDDLTAEVEGVLYGTDISGAHLPTADELLELFEAYTTLRIKYNGDGSYTASGPDDVVFFNEDGSFTISAPTLVFVDDGVFRVGSY